MELSLGRIALNPDFPRSRSAGAEASVLTGPFI
jgi:hypothetical protein